MTTQSVLLKRYQEDKFNETKKKSLAVTEVGHTSSLKASEL
jgi:hypothetical protein